MAFVNRIGNVLKQTMSKNNVESSVLYQAIRSMSSKLFVGGLSYGTDESSLSQAFSQHGEVVEARIIIDRDNGRSRGFGFVTYASDEDAARAIQALDGQDLHGRRIKVNYATEKTRAPRFDGGYGYGSGGGGGGYQGSGGYQGGPYGGGGGGGYDGGNYGNSNTFAHGSNYGRGVDGNYTSENNTYSSNRSIGDLGAGGGNDYFGSGPTNQGGFADPGHDGNANQQLSSIQGEADAIDEDVEPETLDGNYKEDDNDESSDYVNRRG